MSLKYEIHKVYEPYLTVKCRRIRCGMPAVPNAREVILLNPLLHKVYEP